MTEDVMKIKKRRIYELLCISGFDKYEKADKIAQILNKTDKEIILEEKELKSSKSFITDFRETYKSLFEKEEGVTDENKKSK